MTPARDAAPAPPGGNETKIRLLYLTAENWPTFRADVAVLFGKYLPRVGVNADLVACRERDRARSGWGGGAAFLRDTADGLAAKYVR